MFLCMSAVIAAALVSGCGDPAVTLTVPENNATGVAIISGSGLDLGNAFRVEFDKSIDILYGTASILPIPVRISTATAVGTTGDLDLVLSTEYPRRLYLKYDGDYQLDNGTQYTITVNDIWNANKFMGMGNKMDSYTFKFTTQ